MGWQFHKIVGHVTACLVGHKAPKHNPIQYISASGESDL